MSNEFKVKFLGVRGSFPVTGKSTIKYGGNTTCIEIRVNGHLVTIDSGTGIINLGQSLLDEHFSKSESERENNPISLTMLFTHVHQDHIQGLPFFKPVYLNSTNLHMFGPQYYSDPFEKSISNSMFAPTFPVEFNSLQSSMEINSLKGNEVILLKHGVKEPELINKIDLKELHDDQAMISVHRSYAHPNDGVHVYKIEFQGKSFVFATDVEGYEGGDSKIIEFSKGVDLLAHDAQYTKEQYSYRQGFGHSTIDMALDVANAASPKIFALFHHDPSHDDDKLDSILDYAKTRYSNSIMAQEGLTVDLITGKLEYPENDQQKLSLKEPTLSA